jgi:hypothetical protein
LILIFFVLNPSYGGVSDGPMMNGGPGVGGGWMETVQVVCLFVCLFFFPIDFVCFCFIVVCCFFCID